MDLKFKLKQLLVSKQGPVRPPVSPVEGVPSTASHGNEEKEEIKLLKPDPPTDDEILETIEKIYFSDNSFDPSDYELKKLPEQLDLNEIRADRQRLKQQLQVVSKKVSDLILQNQPAYMKELQRVMELQSNLHEALEICQLSRSHLSQAKHQCTEASLGILANCSKRQQLLNVLRSLRTIKTLQQTDVRLREMLEDEDFPGAIQLCLECQKAAVTFRHYKCISELTSKLQDTLEMIEEHLDVALSKVCNNFDTQHYEKLQNAYTLLGKTQIAMDQLHMHFTGAIHNTSFVIVLGYVELCSNGRENNFQKRQYQDLCQFITGEMFIPCLVDLCKALWEVMRSYYKIMEWHSKHDNDHQDLESGDANRDLKCQFNRQYVNQKLEHGVSRIWQDVQQKVKVYLSATDLSGFKFNDFIHVLDLVNRLISVGEEFCGSKSEELQESMRKQSVNYFKNYHRSRMEELRMFLENEGWELCPVKNNFSILQLLNDNLKGRKNFEDSESDDSDIPEELKQDFVDEQTGEVPSRKHSKNNKKSAFKYNKGQGPILTNTTLNVLRLFGKYMQMMTVLKPIAFDVIVYMTQLFDYYMYAVALFFATNLNESHESASNRLRSTLKRIHDNLILDDGCSQIEDFHNDARFREKVLKPNLSAIVDLSSPDKLYGLAERIVAAESVIFLAEQFEYLQQYIDVLIPSSKKAFVQQFYSQTVSLATELRRPIYRLVATNAIDCEQILNHMNNVKWDIKEIMSQHSPYVDILLRMLQVFSMRLSEVCKLVPIPHEAYNILWEYCIKLTNKTFVEGFSNVKKCSNEGRALMQLDFQQFLMKLEKITELRPIPEKEFVELYIKAYYFTENNLEEWIKNHKEYSPKQMTALLNCLSHINKKTRQRLISLAERNFSENLT